MTQSSPLLPPAFQALTSEVSGLAVWDDTWKSFNNCYLLQRDESVCLVDTLKAEQRPELLNALGRMNLTADDVTTVIATHGHADHVGNACIFQKARRYIHPEDRPLLSVDQADLFTEDLPDQGWTSGLLCSLWGDHTPGSCILHDPVSGVSFSGDPLCFFGAPLPRSLLVDEASEIRRATLEYVVTGNIWRDPRCQPDRFLHGLRVLQSLDPTYLATGHGVVLHERLNEFLMALIDSSNSSSHLSKKRFS